MELRAHMRAAQRVLGLTQLVLGLLRSSRLAIAQLCEGFSLLTQRLPMRR